MGEKKSITVGIVLIAIGVLFFLKTMGVVDSYFELFKIWLYWPAVFLIIPGLIFHYAFFNGQRNNPGLLVPGGILLVLGIVFQANMLIGAWSVLWPGYIFAVAVGLFELYIFGPREKGLLIPVGILGGLSLIFFTKISLKQIIPYDIGGFVLPAVLVIIGLSIIFRDKSKRDRF